MRQVSFTEQRILDAKEKFDAWMLTQPPMTLEERLIQRRGFLARWHADLITIGWRRYEVTEVKP